MRGLGKQAKALCTPGEQVLAVGQVVEMLSYWEMDIKVSFIASLTEVKDGEQKRWDYFCRSIAIGYSLSCLHKFASRRISQNQLCCSRRQGWLEFINNYCHTTNIICWARNRAALYGLWNNSPGH